MRIARSAALMLLVVLSVACGQRSDTAALEARIATLEARVAKLEQPKAASTASSPPASHSLPVSEATVISPQRPSDDNWEIVSVASRVTESNDSWSKYAWQLTIRNNATYAQVFDATIEFKDHDGFVVDDDTEYKLAVPASSEETFTGYDLISGKVAGNVASTSAKVKRRL